MVDVTGGEFEWFELPLLTNVKCGQWERLWRALQVF